MTGLRGKPGIPTWSVLYNLARFGGSRNSATLLQCALLLYPSLPGPPGVSSGPGHRIHSLSQESSHWGHSFPSNSAGAVGRDGERG